MLNKNEIKLLETRHGQVIRRLVFTEAGYVQMVNDFHFDGISVDQKKQVLKVVEISPTVRMIEDDLVLEQCIDTKTNESRFEMYRFSDGRLRSISLASNLVMLQQAIGRNRDINRWLTTGLGNALPERLFPNGSYARPETVHVSMATLKNLIPHAGLWAGLTSINPRALAMSFHKVYRLFTKQTMSLSKRGDHSVVEFDPALLEEKDVYYFELPQRNSTAKLLSSDNLPSFKDQLIAKISKIGNVTLATEKSEGQLGYLYGDEIYRIDLIVFKQPTPIHTGNVGME